MVACRYVFRTEDGGLRQRYRHLPPPAGSAFLALRQRPAAAPPHSSSFTTNVEGASAAAAEPSRATTRSGEPCTTQISRGPLYASCSCRECCTDVIPSAPPWMKKTGRDSSPLSTAIGLDSEIRTPCRSLSQRPTAITKGAPGSSV